MNDTSFYEKLGLLIIVGIIVLALTYIAIYAIGHRIGADVATLVGVIVTGLATFGKDIVAALRGLSMSAQLSKVTDQLANSAPAADAATGKPGDPLHVTEDTK